jgi:hypothetical protein
VRANLKSSIGFLCFFFFFFAHILVEATTYLRFVSSSSRVPVL